MSRADAGEVAYQALSSLIDGRMSIASDVRRIIANDIVYALQDAGHLTPDDAVAVPREDAALLIDALSAAQQQRDVQLYEGEPVRDFGDGSHLDRTISPNRWDYKEKWDIEWRFEYGVSWTLVEQAMNRLRAALSSHGGRDDG